MQKIDTKISEIIEELKDLFDNARARNEFEFVLTLINFKGMVSNNANSNLKEWLDALANYRALFETQEKKEKARMGLLFYSTFFENSDFYNILGSLSLINLGYKGSSYLFWKTKKYERLLGIGEKKDFIIEILSDDRRENLIDFFQNYHFKEIRNSFFHSSYSIDEDNYNLIDSEMIEIKGQKCTNFNLTGFFYPILEIVFAFYEEFKKLYKNSFDYYQDNKKVKAKFPTDCNAIILGGKNGLRGFVIEGSCCIIYNEKYDWWEAHDIVFNANNIEKTEVYEKLNRYLKKDDIHKNDEEFFNLFDKIKERNEINEIIAIIGLLKKFGNIRYEKVKDELIFSKKISYYKMALPFYKKACEIGFKVSDMSKYKKIVEEIELEISKK